MKRIIISAVLILAAGGSLVAGSTGAFFSDVETSAANVFVAGSIDLKIDHSLSTYNGNTVAQDLIVVSDPSTTFAGDDGAGNAVNLLFVHPAWTAPIVGANWIWTGQGPSNPTVTQTNTFTRTFNWTGTVTSASMEFAADNYFHVELNGNVVGDNQSLITDNFQQDHLTDVTSYIVQGVNTITFVGKNEHVDNSLPADNPAGIIFRLEVHGSNTNPNPVDLSGQPFWTFDDVKPADQGRDVFSLHVDTNDSWACVLVGNIKNDENTVIEPETTAGDLGGGPIGNGELGQFLHIFMWHDANNDGLFSPLAGEVALTPLTGFSLSGTPATTSITVHDSLFGGVLPGGSTDYVGSAWCAGVLAADNITGAITCDGTNISNPNINQAQTDSTKADLTFYATQSRNQPNFTCASLNQI